MENNTLLPSYVVIAYDATKDRGADELRLVVEQVRLRGDVLHSGNTLLVLGVLHKVPSPLGYLKVCPDSFGGASVRAIEVEVAKKVNMYTSMLLHSAQVCQEEGVNIEVKIIAGRPLKQVIFQEVVACKTTWLILDRHLRRDLQFYMKQIPCIVASVQDNLAVELVRAHTIDNIDVSEHKLFYFVSRPILPLNSQYAESNEQSIISCKSYSLSFGSNEFSNVVKADMMPSSSSSRSEENIFPLDFGISEKQERTGSSKQMENTYPSKYQIIVKHQKSGSQFRSSKAPILCSVCGTRTELYVDKMRFTFAEIQQATDDFSKDNLLGEGGYGRVYKGKLRDGQLIAAKVHKEASTQGFTEFQSEVYVLSFARHKNIVMLLGFCCKEKINILVYEYICNKSLYWHLFDKTANTLGWSQRFAIAIATAKGLRFLHEECRGGPIIHRDLRPSNILLTHDFIPMLGDFGLARWKNGDDPVQTRVLGTFGYLAPEYAENGVVSVKTDIYAFGIVLLQLISGRKVFDEKRVEGQQSLHQWAEPLLDGLALHELIDCRLGKSYERNELYLMAKATSLCMQRDPGVRPSIGEVLRLLEGDDECVKHMQQRFAPQNKKH